jgi:hypothetical protein
MAKKNDHAVQPERDCALLRAPVNLYGSIDASYGNGVQLDIRVRLAAEFLKVPGLVEDVCKQARIDASAGGLSMSAASRAAAFALDLASELVEQSFQLGLAKELPDDDSLPRATRLQLRRQARAQVTGQLAMQQIAQEEAPSVQPAGGIALPPGAGPGRSLV